MLVNRRRSERRLCRSLARIQFGTGSLPRDCTVTDISAGGVKVIAEYVDVPPEFTIILSEGRPRQCRLAWRIGCEFGAQFVD
ncbi:MAG: PilZ protein [Bradyrhizobium sp.]|jgi:PilZ domain|nr:PilZ protein [Bradyrhizobium sp.]